MGMVRHCVLLLCAWLCAGLGQGYDLLPKHVVVIYNEDEAESKELAEYYATKRQIPPQNVVGVRAPKAEEISRAEYDKLLRAPLYDKALADKWWIPSGRLDDPMFIHNVYVLVLMRGMPLKIKQDDALNKPGQKLQGVQAEAQKNAASVDSELAMLAYMDYERNGFSPNPYYKYNEDAVGAGGSVFLVTRIDAPTFADCKRMIDDAIAVEQQGGLQGWTVVDAGGGPSNDGNKWLETVAGFASKWGDKVFIDKWPQTMPKNFPLSDDVTCYFGWYTEQVNGPFLNTYFRFARGAVAAHLHSFSATSMRIVGKNWTAPLIARGAAASFGNVYEPFFQLSHDFSIFHNRLRLGFTLAEAAAMSHPALSWQGVTVGDPLYRPFSKVSPPKEYSLNERRAVLKQDKSRPLADWESLAYAYMQARRWAEAQGVLQECLKMADSVRDIVRLHLALAEVARQQGDTHNAIKIIESMIGLYPKHPAADAAREMLSRYSTKDRLLNKIGM